MQLSMTGMIWTTSKASIYSLLTARYVNACIPSKYEMLSIINKNNTYYAQNHNQNSCCILGFKNIVNSIIHIDCICVDDIAKYATLIIIVIGSTMIIWYGFSITSWISLFSIDSIIHCWIVFLMYEENQKLFGCTCCGHRCWQCFANCMHRWMLGEKGIKKNEIEFKTDIAIKWSVIDV